MSYLTIIFRSNNNCSMGKKRDISNLILMACEKAVDESMRIDDFIKNTYVYARGYEKPLEKSSIARTFKNLQKKGFVELIDEKQLIYRLTDSGLDRALWEKIKRSDEKWDGRWRVVSWDIPERRKEARNLLRYKLKYIGFVQFQKSVWGSKINCTKQLREFIKKVGIEDWVKVFESDNIGD